MSVLDLHRGQWHFGVSVMEPGHANTRVTALGLLQRYML
jgi:hypothetical protein